MANVLCYTNFAKINAKMRSFVYVTTRFYPPRYARRC